MSSEKQYLSKSQKEDISVSSSESQERDERLHITTKGKDGKVLRKKLAIALGLRTNSSASTTSQSEGEDSQNVVEAFRKQVRKTVDFRTKNLPKVNQEKEEQISDKGSLIMRKMVRKTTDISGEFLEENQYDNFDDFDETETVSSRRSKDHHSMTAEELETFSRDRSHVKSDRTARNTTKNANIKEPVQIEYGEEDGKSKRSFKKASSNEVEDNRKTTARKKETFDRKTHDKAGKYADKSGSNTEIENWDLKRKLENQDELLKTPTSDSHGVTNFEKNLPVVQSEEICSSFGEQSEPVPSGKQFEDVSEPQSSARESVKILRERIRKNARARQMPRGTRVNREKAEGNPRRQESIPSIPNIQSSAELDEDSSLPSDKKKHHFGHASSNIPLSLSSRNSTETQGRAGVHSYLDTKKAENDKDSINQNLSDLPAKLVQRSKIPRRKSQNSKDEMGTGGLRLKVDETEGQSVNTQNIITVQSFDGKSVSTVSKTDREKSLQQNSWQNTNSNINLSKLLTKASRTSKDSLIPTAVTKRKISLDANETSTKNKNTNNVTNTSVRQNTYLDETSRYKRSSTSQFDFEFFEAELNKLKASVFKTYEDFKDIRKLTVNVREDLNELRTTYGSSL